MAGVHTTTPLGARLANPVCTVAGNETEAWVTVTGPVDRTTVASVRNRLLHVAKAQPTRLTVDLDGAALVDGAAVAALVELWQFASEHDIELSVRTPAASVRQVFDLDARGRVHAIRS
jgi:anti-anti-sigma factor